MSTELIKIKTMAQNSNFYKSNHIKIILRIEDKILK